MALERQLQKMDVVLCLDWFY